MRHHEKCRHPEITPEDKEKCQAKEVALPEAITAAEKTAEVEFYNYSLVVSKGIVQAMPFVF
jgi:hypothetical protein